VSEKRRKTSVNVLDEAARLGREFRTNPEMVFRFHLGQCSTSVRIAIENARELAKCNKKDEAREWCRFINNSHILDVISHCCGEDSVSQMRSEMSLLRGECHPLDVPDFRTDLGAIRAHLEGIRGAADELLRRSGGPALGVVNGGV
jgi:hypothetical protein